jgi:hypothetical protein
MEIMANGWQMDAIYRVPVSHMTALSHSKFWVFPCAKTIILLQLRQSSKMFPPIQGAHFGCLIEVGNIADALTILYVGGGTIRAHR